MGGHDFLKLFQIFADQGRYWESSPCIIFARRVVHFYTPYKIFYMAMLLAICHVKSTICRITSASIYFHEPAVISLTMYITFLTHNHSKSSPINATIYGLCHLFLHAGPCLIGVTLA